VDLPSNPFAILGFVSAPAVLTNASCVLLFGTGNRYGRAIDRVHELSEMIDALKAFDVAELHLRIRQLEAGEKRTSLIVRALTCFYAAVSGFVCCTLISLVGAALISARIEQGVSLCFAVAFFAGTAGVSSMVTGATMLVYESRYSFRILREESGFLVERAHRRIQPDSVTSQDR
jgi:hypothetical protein